jgi:catechol 2,3-dioxygenase-like lactoylglutathione lyase family enzyme
MASAMPHGRTLDTDFMFTKLVVHDLERAVQFYTSVFGLVEMHRLDAEIVGRAVSEVVFMPTSDGGPMFVLLRYLDAAGPVVGEQILGFSTLDLDALVERVDRAGGKLLERKAAGGFEHAFVADPEGHLLQISHAAG